MLKKLIAVLVGVALLTADVAWFPSAGRAQRADLGVDIQKSGSALFYKDAGPARWAVWTVSCRLPMRGCVARAAGIAVHVEPDGNARINSFVPTGGRVSIIRGNLSWDANRIFSSPLERATIERLDAPGTELLVEGSGEVVIRTPTEGISGVIDYLAWLGSREARATRDARTWNGEGKGMAHFPPVPGTERWEAERVQTLSPWAQPIPNTKPQIEFAIRSQFGDSLFDATGH